MKSSRVIIQITGNGDKDGSRNVGSFPPFNMAMTLEGFTKFNPHESFKSYKITACFMCL